MADFLSAEWLAALDEALRATPNLTAIGPVVIEQVVRDVPDLGVVRYQLRIDDRGAGIATTSPAPPDVRLTTDYETAVTIARGEQNAQTALALGRLQLGGDIDALVQRSDALAALGDATAALRAATTYRTES